MPTQIIIEEELEKAGIIGKIKINSTSKIKKTIESIKNRIEKGSRAEVLGVNPHSKGLAFSRSQKSLTPKSRPNLRRRAASLRQRENLSNSGNLDSNNIYG